VIPYGGGIITDDIKEGCSIIEKHAEQLKVKFGSSVPELEKDSTYVTIRDCTVDRTKRFR
jgi:cell division protein FtsA